MKVTLVAIPEVKELKIQNGDKTGMDKHTH